jgi:hypothetical protein
LGYFHFNIKYDDCYPFIFTNIKGPILVKEEDIDAYIRSHEDDFIGQAEESLPIKSCRRLFELFDIDTITALVFPIPSKKYLKIQNIINGTVEIDIYIVSYRDIYHILRLA